LAVTVFEHPAYLNSGTNNMEAYIYWGLGEIIVVHPQKFQGLNINKSYVCKFDGISTKDLHTQTYFMS
jgi:hypothetical protein